MAREPPAPSTDNPVPTVKLAILRRGGPLRAALASSLLLPGLLAAQDSVRTVTLDEAVSRALEAAPALASAEAGRSSARADLLQSGGAFLPSLSLNSGYTNSSNQRFDQSTGRLISESYTAQAQLSYELFSGGRRLADRRSAGASTRAAEAVVREQHFATVLAAKTAFYGAAAAAELVGVAGQRLARARQQMDFARTRLEVGSATRSDVLRAELEQGNAELAVVDAESALRSARLNLARQMGEEGEVRPAPAALPEHAPALPHPDSLAVLAERRSPAAVAAAATHAQRRAGTTAAYTAYAPSLRATAGYDWFSFQFPPEERSWNVRLFASLPVFNGFQREAALQRARASERAAASRARDAALAARVAAEDAAREIGSAERRVEIARRSVELAREDLRVVEERYRIGNANIVELQTSQLALAEAEAAWVRARQGLGVSVARLEAVLGEELGG